MQRWRGLVALVRDAVDHGSRAVERVQVEMAKRPFDILEQIPPLEVPVKGIHLIHDTAVSGIHGMIRLVNGVAGETIDLALTAVEKRDERRERAAAQAEAAPQAEPAAPPQPEREAAAEPSPLTPPPPREP